jgi:hypothetical protein
MTCALHAPHSEQLAGFSLQQEQMAYEMKLKGMKR